MSEVIKGIPQLQRRLKAIGDTRGLLHKLQLDTTAEAKRIVRAQHPRTSGDLGRSIEPGYITSHEALVVAHAGYAAYVELGTRPHIIRPRNGQFLRFPAKGVQTTRTGRVRTSEVRRLGKGAYTFAREVHHPGTKPEPFLLPGAKKAASDDGMKDLIIERWNSAA